MTFVWVVAGAAIGAPTRYGVSRGLNHLRGFPWGTPWWSTAGSLVLGGVLGAVSTSASGDQQGWQVGVVALGGAFTTYSAFAQESVELDHRRGLLYTLATIGGSLGAGSIGWWWGAS